MTDPTSTSHNETNLSAPPPDGPGVIVGGLHIDLEKCERVNQAIMFTDIESSVNLAGTLGAERYAEVLTRHGQLFQEAIATAHAAKIEKHTGDGFMVRFEQASEAVGAALRFQWLLRREEWNIGHPLRVRVGIHKGEILLIPATPEMPGTIGTAVNLAARVLNMADGGQVLLTQTVFDEARQFIRTIPGVPPQEQLALGWEAHGAYLLKGIEGPAEIFEVGERGRAPFRRPRNSAGAERSVSAEEEATLGWRPGAEMEVPKRPGWRLLRPLGQGGFGEVWLGENRQTGGARVFKFCFDVVRLRSLKREVALFRLIQKALGPRRDIATLYDVQLETSPFFLESEYCGGGTLEEWLKKKLSAGEVPLAQRLTIVAAIARALAAAHSVGIIHKDVKPSNVFIEELADGTVQPRLADFGIGELSNHAALEALALSQTNMWTMTSSSSHTGTQMYSAPEYMVAPQASVPGDIFSLGVLLYQFVVGNFHQPMGTGWRRDVPDDLLADDIAACVDVEPTRRPSSAANLAERLETLDQRRTEQAEKEAAARRERELEEKVLAQRKKIRQGLFIAGFAAVVITGLAVIAFVLQHSRDEAVNHARVIAKQREREQDQHYREDMIASLANIDNSSGEAVRDRVERNRPIPGERDRRGWEWGLADATLNPPHHICEVSTRPLRALAVSPDEKSAAVAGDDGKLSIWSCDTLEKIDSWEIGAVRCLAWKGEVLAIGLASGEVVLWDMAGKRVRRRWQAHEGPVTTLAWNPAQDELTTGGAEGANGVIAWWQGDGTPLQQLSKQGPVLALDWEADGSQLATLLGNPARLIAGMPDKLDHEYPTEMPDSVIAWRPGVNEVAASMKNYAMCSFDPYLADNSLTLPKLFSPGTSALAWAADGTRVAVGGIDGKIILLDARHPKEIGSELYGHRHRVTALHWLGRERLLSIGDDGTLRAWDDLRRPAHVHPLEFSATLAAARWHPQAERLAVLIAGDEVQIFDATDKVVWVRPMPPPIHGQLPFTGGGLAWSPDGNWLAAVCPQRGLVAWRMNSEERFLAGLDDAFDIQWLDDSSGLLVRTAKGWSRIALAGGPPVMIADEHTAWIGEVGRGFFGKVSMDEHTIHFSAGRPGTAPTIDVRLPKELGTVETCALSADHSRLAIGGETGELVWVDTQSGKVTHPARMHSSAIQAIGWLHNGSRLVTASADGTGRVIDVAHEEETWVIEHLDPAIVGAGWSDDQRRLMFASASRHEIRIYEIPHPADRANQTRAAALFAALEEHPDEESAWSGLAQELRTSKDEHSAVLRAVVELGAQARFAPLAGTQLTGLTPAASWEGEALPRVLQVAQACAFERWDEVLALSSGNASAAAASWLSLAKAEALAHLGRKKEAEQANLAALRALWQLQATREPTTIPTLTGNGKSSIDLAPFATARPQDDWVFEDETGNENNNLAGLLSVIGPCPDGMEFQCGNFILLAGKTIRLTTGRMLPRSTFWIPFNTASQRISCVVAACNTLEPAPFMDTCIGSIFLLRSDGGAIRIPLVFGRNIWRWWKPEKPAPSDAPPGAIVWEGKSSRATYRHHSLALYRLDWTADPGDAPVVAIAIVSNLRQPAPLLMSVDARR